jgi:inorganic pyrophosphatase
MQIRILAKMVAMCALCACIVAPVVAEQLPGWAQGQRYDECVISAVTYAFANGTPYDVVTYGVEGVRSDGTTVCYIPVRRGAGSAVVTADDEGEGEPIDIPEFGWGELAVTVVASLVLIGAMRGIEDATKDQRGRL